MAVLGSLEGKYIILRAVELTDASFTLEIRKEPELTTFIPRVDISIVEQEQWILNQQKKEGDYFFIMESKQRKPVGTVAFYNIDYSNRTCEFGRYISRGNALENVEAACLLLDYIFSTMNWNMVIFNNNEKNKRVIGFWKRFGAVFYEKVDFESWTAAQYRLLKSDYLAHREKIYSLL